MSCSRKLKITSKPSSVGKKAQSITEEQQLDKDEPYEICIATQRDTGVVGERDKDGRGAVHRSICEHGSERDTRSYLNELEEDNERVGI